MRVRQLWVVAALGGFGANRPPSPGILPAPSGPFAIGRVTYDWVDSSRAEFLDNAVSARREVMVDVWYPAAAPALRGKPETPAPYLPEVSVIRRVMGDSAAQRWFAPSFARVAAGGLVTHAYIGATVRCPANGCPVLIFSHGGGVDRSAYTAQYEDLASHGFVVAAIAHTFDTRIVVFPDGRIVRFRPQPKDTIPPDPSLPLWRQGYAREQRSMAYTRRGIQLEAADIRFTIDQLARYARNPRLGAPFAGRLNLRAIGALGHSAGGEAAALACQLDARIKACLNQDGAMHGLPFSRDSSGRTMRQPFLYFTRLLPRPVDPDSVLAAMQMTRAEMDSILDDVWGGAARLLSDMPAGAYLLSLNVPGMTHMSFSDEPLLESVGDSTKTAQALRSLRLVSSYTRAFFEKTLLGREATVLDGQPAADAAAVRIERLGSRPRN